MYCSPRCRYRAYTRRTASLAPSTREYRSGRAPVVDVVAPEPLVVRAEAEQWWCFRFREFVATGHCAEAAALWTRVLERYPRAEPSGAALAVAVELGIVSDARTA